MSLTIDWEELRKQKEWLAERAQVDQVQGLLNLIDALQEDAIENGTSEDVVYGEQARCPNCNEPIGSPSPGCVLHAMIHCVGQRSDIKLNELRKLHVSCDPDKLWADVGPIIDNLEEGKYS